MCGLTLILHLSSEIDKIGLRFANSAFNIAIVSEASDLSL